MQRIRIHLVLVFIKIISFHYFIYGERSLYLSPYYSLVAENGKEIPTPNILDSIWTTIVETDIEPADKDPNIENYNSSHNNEFDQRKNTKRFMSFHLYIFPFKSCAVWLYLFILAPKVDILHFLF